ncbi:MAG TPA: hypothetical protein VLI72_03655 [Methylibium sp.]|nr:hypothetical protein [Methylibium sp.]
MITAQSQVTALPQRQMRMLMTQAIEWLVVIGVATVGLWCFID